MKCNNSFNGAQQHYADNRLRSLKCQSLLAATLEMHKLNRAEHQDEHFFLCKTVLESTNILLLQMFRSPPCPLRYWVAPSKWFRAHRLFKTSACVLCQSKNTKLFSSCSDSVNPCLRVCLGFNSKDWDTWRIAAGASLCRLYVYVLSGCTWLCKGHPFVPVPVGWTEFTAKEWPWAQGESPFSGQD